MPGHDVIVVGASAGGVEALDRLVAALPDDLPASLFVVLHVPPTGRSALPDILRRHCRLPVAHAIDGEAVKPGQVYVAPPDQHLLVADGQVRLGRGARENGHRPAIDPLFRSAAREYGPRVVGVVLSGVLDDGTAGLAAVKAGGGVAIVQEPADAMYPAMPQHALENVAVDHVLAAGEIAAALDRLAREPARGPGRPDRGSSGARPARPLRGGGDPTRV